VREVVVPRPGLITIQENEVPEHGDSDAVVRMRFVGICGSDVHASHGRHPFIELPYRPGHEVVGVVTQVGTSADLKPGTRVVIDPVHFCGQCQYCRDGRTNLCVNLSFFGCGTPHGGMSESFVIPARQLLPIPDDLSDLQAVLIEPLATPVHAVGLAGDLGGRSVAILGAGTIGLLTLAAARRAGAGRVVVTDISPSKRERALRLGADAAFDPAQPGVTEVIRSDVGGSLDVVFDCVSIQSTIDQAIALSLKGGTVVIVGVPSAAVQVPLPLVQDRQIRMVGSAMFVRSDLEKSMQMIREGIVHPDDFITAVRSFEEAPDAFALADSGEQIKVVLQGP
jgi:2-desacetyl-2-hydroxyethyl bacteriochlorophyllide A dehydrogenase